MKEEWRKFLESLLSPFSVVVIISLFTFGYFLSLIPPSEHSRPFNSERHQTLFFQCLESLKDVNKRGHYNDSNEVVLSCNRISRSMAQDEYQEE